MRNRSAPNAAQDGQHTHPDDVALSQLRVEFTGYRFFRAVRSDGRLGEWVASLHDPRAGVDPTVMCPTAEKLRATLIKEAERAAARWDEVPVTARAGEPPR